MKDLHQTTWPPGASRHSVCLLCLGTFGNVLYINPCLHRFCFSCSQGLLETKAECPCCNQPFSSIFHPVKIKELPSPRQSKGESSSSSPTKKHPKEEHASLPAKKRMEKHQPSKSHSEDVVTLPCENHPISRPNLKRPHKPSSLKSALKDRSLHSGFTKREAHHECHHLSVLGKKPNPSKVTLESVQDETAFKSTLERMKSGDNDQDDLGYRATSANLSRPNLLEATLLLISSGVVVFICFYIYLCFVLLHK